MAGGKEAEGELEPEVPRETVSAAIDRVAVASLPWVEKYRPDSLDDLIAHEHIIGTINRLIDSNRLPHLLFYGPPGTGKTSTILACAKRLYGSTYKRMTLELNASDDRGIGVVRDQIKSFASTRLFSKGVKLVVLDEADAMTSDAQFALRRVMEKYSRSTRFCLICNYVSRIIPALQSRCTRFRFAPLKRSQIEGRLRDIVTAEKVRCEEAGVKAILRLAGGDMRRVLNVLQATALAHEVVSEASVYATTGDPPPSDVNAAVQALLNEPFRSAHATIRSLQVDKGLSLTDLVHEIAKIAARLAVSPPVRISLLTQLADIEHRLNAGVGEELQVGALVGAFAIAREMQAKEA